MSDMSLLVDDDLLNDDYFVSPADIVMTETDEKANKKISFIKVLFCVLCFLLLGELVVYKYIMPAFASPKVTVFGQKN